MSGIVNKVKEALHHDKKTENTGAHSSTHTGENLVHGDNNRGVHSNASRTDGPHSSNLANKADPRVDSDADRSRNLGANPSGTANTGVHSGAHTGTTGLHSGTTGTHTGTSGLHSGTTGVHSGAHTGAHTGTTGLHSGTTGTHTGTSGLHTGSTGVHSGTTGENFVHGDNRGVHSNASRTDGPHSSNVGNKLDPRIDSDADRSHNLGANPSGTANTGVHSGAHTGTGLHTGTAGGSPAVGGFGSNTHSTHGTSGVTGAHGTHGVSGSQAPGPAPNTAGQHKSDIANKLDPRIDSDLDGSKTVGQDKTFAR